MSAAEAIITVVREWLTKADHDLLAAVHLLKLGKTCPPETVAFHAQQCVEKHHKALLVFRGTPFPKSHDIRLVRALLPPRFRPKLAADMQKLLTEYAAVTRYPNSPEISLTAARQAVKIARQVRKEIRQHLPTAALRRVKK